jgi:O-antigen/teichoic acid export membrane protein
VIESSRERPEAASSAAGQADGSLAPDEIRSRLTRSGLSSYGILVLRLLVALLLTRILFLNLSRLDYGFWALLWSVFSYAMILDLGFGLAMAKHASQASVRGNWNEFNHRFNTVFFSSCLLASLIAMASLICVPFVPQLLRLETSGSEGVAYQIAFLIFGLGTAISFPLGVFGEVLRGLNQIPLRNNIQTAGLLTNFALLSSIVHWELGLPYMATASVAVTLAANVVVASRAKRLVPGFRLSWRLFDRSLLRSTLSFSILAYVATVSMLIMLRSDQLVISAFLSVALVASYQVVWRLSFFFNQLSVQMLAALGPVASVLFEAREQDKLRDTLLGSGRVVSGIATFMFPPLVIYLEPLLKAWLKLEDPDAALCGALLLTAAYFSVVFKSTTVQVMLMCKRERTLAATTLAEATLNLALSIALCTLMDLGIVGVALGTLIPCAALSLFVYFPMTCQLASLSPRAVVRRTMAGNLIPGLLAATTYYVFRSLSPPQDLVEIIVNALPGAVIFFVSFFYSGLDAGERRALRRRFSRAAVA